MNALELRLIAYGLAALVLLGGSGYVGHKLTANHYERVLQAEHAAQEKAVLVEQQKTIAAQAAQQAAAQAAEKQYADLQSHVDDLSQRLAGSVSDYTKLRSGLVSATATSATLADAAREGAERNSQLAELVRQATSACESDAAQLTALQLWAKDVGH